jgi:hypothetical protein
VLRFINKLKSIVFFKLKRYMSMSTGFRGVGKLHGANAVLFTHVVQKTVREMWEADIDTVLAPGKYPLYRGLSPHHRVCLLADLCLGLLVEESPLPPDTLEHHSAFLAVYDTAFELAEAEMEMHADFVAKFPAKAVAETSTNTIGATVESSASHHPQHSPVAAHDGSTGKKDPNVNHQKHLPMSLHGSL